jgi:hypothetical protein
MLIAVLVSAALTMIWSTPPARWLHWIDFSKVWMLVGLFGTFALLCLISAVGSGLVTFSSKHAADVSILQQLAAGVAAQAALRRGKPTGRGSTLALGILPEFQAWVDGFVADRIRKWAEGLDDDSLLAAAAAMDSKSRGLGTRASISQRASWRDARASELAQRGSMHAEARLDLINMIKTGYGTYLLRKPT